MSGEAKADLNRPTPSALEEVTGSGRLEFDSFLGAVWLSPGAAALHGMAECGHLPLSQLLDRIHPEDRGLLTMPAPGSRLRCEYRLLGTECWIEARGGLVAAPDGQDVRLVALVLDVTERKTREARSRLVLREVEHRAKNALATAQALVRLTKAEDPRDFARSVEQRLAVLGRAHARLSTAPPGTGFSLRPLLEEAFGPYEASRTLVLRGPEMMLAAAAVQPVCMALHELATNAAKYGALSRAGGQVALRWRRTQTGGLVLAWRESGGPALTAVPGRRGFGLSMIEAVVHGQLGGRIRFDWAPPGLRLALSLPPSCVKASD